MQIHITQPAIRYFHEEFDLNKGKSIRIFARYGGLNQVINGFSIGISIDQPKAQDIKKEIDGLSFFIAQQDLWLFKDQKLEIKYSRKQEEIVFSLTSEQNE
ncbi:uncharacterized protein YneR [Geomicrobium halophilum]|uniref:Uncharacterized protein YneR n=1 Tax=Geomicrobium halophilum TaxID=549000 RepID=A0A841PIF8_9BACL|nr:HesB/YadR/YfhF family protein [Geomicrobium halophilum]MBB6448580.1 uncharacterized protein YneR [Geomicrobium halophilum]